MWHPHEALCSARGIGNGSNVPHGGNDTTKIFVMRRALLGGSLLPLRVLVQILDGERAVLLDDVEHKGPSLRTCAPCSKMFQAVRKTATHDSNEER